MHKQSAFWAVALSFFLGGASQAVDTIKTAKGTLPGRVVGMDATKVEFEQGQGGGLFKEVPVNQIQTIFYEGEPRELRAAKTLVLSGRYSEALNTLERIKNEPGRPEVQQDLEFYKALCAAKLALGGSMTVSEAGQMMRAFADGNPKNYHYFEASETVGDLLVAIGQYAKAAEYYARLDAAPWPDYKMRAGVAAGRVFLAQEKVSEAVAAFDKVIGMEADGDLAQQQRTLAILGKARALIAQKKPDDAVKMVEDVLKKADVEDVPLMAQAYNVLGTAQREAGRVKEALLAFLHVDLLYSSVPDAHAEALANLVDLWEQVHKAERANRARQTLEEQYQESPWSKKVAK